MVTPTMFPVDKKYWWSNKKLEQRQTKALPIGKKKT